MSPPILDPIRGALLRSQPDTRLVTLVREGRERAFEEIVRRYRAPLVGFAAMIVPADRADDVVQEALVAAYTALLESGSEIVLRPWLFRIVRNRALNDLRDTPTADPLPEELDGVAQPSEIAERNEQVAALFGGLQDLPAQQRDAIVARELEGRGHAEIAAELGTSAGAVRQLIFRARGSLREAAGFLVPLPVLRFLLGPAGPEASAAATTAGIAALAGGGAATGVGTKVAVGLAGVALAVGGGIAVERNGGGDDGRGESGREAEDGQALASSGERGGGDRGAEGPGDSGSRAGSGHGGSGSGDDGGGGGRGDDGGGGESGDDHGGHGGGETSGSSGSGGGGGSSGHGGGDDDDVEDFDDDDNSGSGSSGSGSSGSDDDFEPIETDIDDDVYPTDSSGSGSSGSGSGGSGSSGSGSSGSGSSGSGSDDFDDEIDD